MFSLVFLLILNGCAGLQLPQTKSEQYAWDCLKKTGNSTCTQHERTTQVINPIERSDTSNFSQKKNEEPDLTPDRLIKRTEQIAYAGSCFQEPPEVADCRVKAEQGDVNAQ